MFSAFSRWENEATHLRTLAEFASNCLTDSATQQWPLRNTLPGVKTASAMVLSLCLASVPPTLQQSISYSLAEAVLEHQMPAAVTQPGALAYRRARGVGLRSGSSSAPCL
ncbi:hypothetical protein AOLI_G00223010 [Acnodon oligacanthus]